MANFLENSLYFMTRPIRDLVELGNITQKGLNVKRAQAPIYTQQELLDFANNGGSKAFMADSRNQQFQKDLSKSQAAYDKVVNYKPIALKNEEMGGLLNYDRAFKDAAIVGSMMAPGLGSGLGGAIASGALSGGLSGYGGSQRGQELGSTIGGVALGGALGAAGYGVMKAGTKLFNKGKGGFKYNEFFGKNAGTLDDIGGPVEAKKTLELMDELFDAYELPKNTKMQRAEGLAKLRDITGSGIGRINETSTSKIPAQQLKEMLEGSVDEFTSGQKKELLEVVGNLITKNADEAGMLSTKSVDNISDVVVEMAGGYEKLAGQGSQKIAANRVKEMIRKVLVGDKASGITGMAPELAPLKQIYSTIMKSKDPVYALASKGGQGVRFYGPEVGSEVLGKLFDTVTRKSAEFGAGAGKVVGAPGKLGDLLYNNTMNEAARTGGIGAGALKNGTNLLGQPFSGSLKQQLSKLNPAGMFGSAVVNQNISGMQNSGVPGEGMPQEEPDYSQFIDPETGFLVMPNADGSMGGQASGMQPQQEYTIRDGMREAIQMMPGASEAQIMSLAKVLVDEKQSASGSGRPLTAGATSDFADVREAMDLLPQLSELLEEGKSAFGPIEGTIRGLNPWDRTGQSAKATIKLVKQIIGKGLEGGVLRKEDEEKYADILPKLGDTEATVANKIEGLRITLKNKQNNLLDSYGSAGYDVSGFQGYGTLDELGNLGYGQ